MFLDNTTIRQRVDYLKSEANSVMRNPECLTTEPAQMQLTAKMAQKFFSMNPFNKETQQRYREAMARFKQSPCVQSFLGKLDTAKGAVQNAGKAVLKNAKKIVLTVAITMLIVSSMGHLHAKPMENIQKYNNNVDVAVEKMNFDKDYVVSAFENKISTSIENFDEVMRQIVAGMDLSVFESGSVNITNTKDSRTTKTIKNNTEYVKVEVGGELAEYSERDLSKENKLTKVIFNSNGSIIVSVQDADALLNTVFKDDKSSTYGEMLGQNGVKTIIMYDEQGDYKALATQVLQNDGSCAVNVQNLTHTIDEREM